MVLNLFYIWNFNDGRIRIAATTNQIKDLNYLVDS